MGLTRGAIFPCEVTAWLAACGSESNRNGRLAVDFRFLLAGSVHARERVVVSCSVLVHSIAYHRLWRCGTDVTRRKKCPVLCELVEVETEEMLNKTFKDSRGRTALVLERGDVWRTERKIVDGVGNNS